MKQSHIQPSPGGSVSGGAQSARVRTMEYSSDRLWVKLWLSLPATLRGTGFALKMHVRNSGGFVWVSSHTDEFYYEELEEQFPSKTLIAILTLYAG